MILRHVQIIIPEGEAGLDLLKQAFAQVSGLPGRKIALLGDMRGLGADELKVHAALAPHIVEAGFERVFTVGECMRALRGALPRPMRAAQADTVELIEEALCAELAEGDCLLAKGGDEDAFRALAARLQGEGADHVV